MIDFTKDPLFEEARIYAETQMRDGWDRKCHIELPIFYQHFTSYIYTHLQPYKKIAEGVTEIFHYGHFKAETRAEQELEQMLTEVRLWPTTEDEIIKRKYP